MSNNVTIAAIIGIVILAAIALSSLGNKEDLKRLQALKNKRRFSGKRLSGEEHTELENLQKKYWWY